ncbi:MAG: DUF615 domain-containing protein, partial [Gammaproteobacteria bacterium]|nr:DUF615 domain-containing protein [Gammaproteobacteria bacterium]
MMTDEIDPFDEEDILISKSQLKREAHALLDLGDKLIKLKKSDFDKMPLDDNLREAILAARNMKQNGALKRQTQYVGKLLRKADADPILAAYESLNDHYQEDIKQFHQLEQWRDRLLTEGDKALAELIEEYPDTDRQHLRQMIRNAQKEKLENKAPRAARELFQYI